MNAEEIYKTYDPNNWPWGRKHYAVIWLDFAGHGHLYDVWAKNELDAAAQFGVHHAATNCEIVSVKEI